MALQVRGPSCGASELIATLLQLCMLLETTIFGSACKDMTKCVTVLRNYKVEILTNYTDV